MEAGGIGGSFPGSLLSRQGDEAPPAGPARPIVAGIADAMGEAVGFDPMVF
jgi:hypothetical protein